MAKEILHRRLHNLATTVALLCAMVAVLAGVGFVFGGGIGVAYALGAALLFTVFAPHIGPTRLFRSRGARRLGYGEGWLGQLVVHLASRAGLPRAPDVYILPVPVPQAMATRLGGRAAVAVTPTLLELLGPRELAAVLAHELSHLAHRDLWVSRVAEIVHALTRSMAQLGLLLVLLQLPMVVFGLLVLPWGAVLLLLVAPLAVRLLALWLSRTRELDADVGAVAITGDPLALASALCKLEEYHRMPWWMSLLSVEVPEWLKTHPSVQDRVAHLRRIARPPEPAPPKRAVKSRPGPGRQQRPARRVVIPEWRPGGRRA